MVVPEKIVALKWLTVIVGVYGVIWIGLEGAMWHVILLAIGLILISVLYLFQRILGGRELTSRRWLILCGGLGLVSGLTCVLLSLALMAIKTGLHGHGPEFTSADIEWVIGQAPLWTLAGLLAGLGAGILAMASQRPQR
jgi:hypothetical protein